MGTLVGGFAFLLLLSKRAEMAGNVLAIQSASSAIISSVVDD